MKYFLSIVKDEIFIIQQAPPHFVCKLMCFNSDKDITTAHVTRSIHAYSFPMPDHTILLVLVNTLADYHSGIFKYQNKALTGSHYDSFISLAKNFKTTYFIKHLADFKRYNRINFY